MCDSHPQHAPKNRLREFEYGMAFPSCKRTGNCRGLMLTRGITFEIPGSRVQQVETHIIGFEIEAIDGRIAETGIGFGSSIC